MYDKRNTNIFLKDNHTKIGKRSKINSKNMYNTKATSNTGKIYRESTFMDVKIDPEKVIINILAIKSKNPYNLKYTYCNPLRQGLAKVNYSSKKLPQFWVTIFSC